MASFFERNKKKSLLALLLLFLKWRKGLGALLVAAFLLMFGSFAPSNLMGFVLVAAARLPGGAHVAAGVSWAADKLGLRVRGLEIPSDRRSYRDLIAAFKSARTETAPRILRGAGAGLSPGAGSSLDMVRGDPARMESNASLGAKVSGGDSVKGIMTPKEAQDAQDASSGVALTEEDLSGERAGAVNSAYAGWLAGAPKLAPAGSPLGSVGAFAGRDFFSSSKAGSPNLAGSASGQGPSSGQGPFSGQGPEAGGFSSDRFGRSGAGQLSTLSQGTSAKGKGGKLREVKNRGSRSVNLGRRGLRSSRALAQLRNISTLNSKIWDGGSPLESNSAAARQQFEGASVGNGGITVPEPPGGFNAPAVPGGFDGGMDAGTIPNVPHIGDPGVICTSQQLLDGYFSDGAKCVKPEDFNKPNKKNVTPWQDLVDKALMALLIGFALFMVASFIMDAAAPLLDSKCTYLAGVVLMIIALVILAFAISFAARAIQLGSEINSQGGGGQFQGILLMIAGSSMIMFMLASWSAAWGGGGGAAVRAAQFFLFFLLVPLILVAIGRLIGGTIPDIPETPEIKSQSQEYAEDREALLELNANKGGGDTGLDPAPVNMHYEKIEGEWRLFYDHPVDSPPSPMVLLEMNKNKGGDKTGLPAAEKGMHYEYDETAGEWVQRQDNVIGVGVKLDVNAFKGGGETGLEPAPDGKHYERDNKGQWVLRDDYPVTREEMVRANSAKGGGLTGLKPAPEGFHYELKPSPQLVPDYAVS